MITSYENGVWLVDLAPLGDPRLVPSAVATGLGLDIGTGDLLHSLVAHLKDNRMLLLFDNCEHLIEAAANLVGRAAQRSARRQHFGDEQGAARGCR